MRCGIETESAPDRLAQIARRAVGIVLQMAGDGLVGRDRLRTRPERRLVGGQLVHLGDARRAALAGNIGLDLEHAGTRGWGHAIVIGLSSLAEGRPGAPYSGSHGCRRGPCERTEAPIPTKRRDDVRCRPAATETSSAAPSNARSGTAVNSTSGATALAAAAPSRRPGCSTLRSRSRSRRGDAGDREHRQPGRMIGALDEWQAGDDFRRGVPPAPPTRARPAWRRRGQDRGHPSTPPPPRPRPRPQMGVERHGEAEMKPRAVAHRASPADRSACTRNGACT